MLKYTHFFLLQFAYISFVQKLNKFKSWPTLSASAMLNDIFRFARVVEYFVHSTVK